MATVAFVLESKSKEWSGSVEKFERGESSRLHYSWNSAVAFDPGSNPVIGNYFIEELFNVMVKTPYLITLNA